MRASASLSEHLNYRAQLVTAMERFIVAHELARFIAFHELPALGGLINRNDEKASGSERHWPRANTVASAMRSRGNAAA